MPVLLGSLLLVLMAVDLNQRSPARSPYPHHWL
jgi:CBS-domain-containing membrane protein